MKNGKKTGVVTLDMIRAANKRLISKGIGGTNGFASAGGLTISIERGTLSYHQVVSKKEMSLAYQKALMSYE